MSTLSLWTRRDPFADFRTLDALVREVFGPTAQRPAYTSFGFTPAAEVSRDGQDAVVRVEVPGLDVTKDVTVEVDRGRLVVRGERREESTRTQGGRTLSEVRYGVFRRAFDLPEHVTADAVTASYDAGVLTVRVAGAYADAVTGARTIAITSGTQSTEALEARPSAEAEQAEAEAPAEAEQSE